MLVTIISRHHGPDPYAVVRDGWREAQVRRCARSCSTGDVGSVTEGEDVLSAHGERVAGEDGSLEYSGMSGELAA